MTESIDDTMNEVNVDPFQYPAVGMEWAPGSFNGNMNEAGKRKRGDDEGVDETDEVCSVRSL